jgi:DNA-binding NarL/FixJ family response regulator
MCAPRSIRVFVVEDHPIVRDGYALILGAEESIELCGFASSEAEAAASIGDVTPDLVIVDLILDDGGSGIELIRQVHQRYPQVRMLVISGSDESLYAGRSIDAGASGYLSKRSASGNLIRAIHRVMSGEIVLSSRIASQLLKSRSSRSNGTHNSVQNLTNRELQVFRMIGEGCATPKIADLLFLSPRTVERHRENIKRKLQLTNSTELVRHATRWTLENR